MDQIIWISNIEIYEFCKLNLETGEKSFMMIILDLKSLTVSILKIKKFFSPYLHQRWDPNYIIKEINIS